MIVAHQRLQDDLTSPARVAACEKAASSLCVDWVVWGFSTWQPDQVPLTMDRLATEDWQLGPDDRWHGFSDLKPGQAILDPIKVTLLCPGLGAAKSEVGIPAAVVSKYLWEHGLTVEAARSSTTSDSPASSTGSSRGSRPRSTG